MSWWRDKLSSQKGRGRSRVVGLVLRLYIVIWRGKLCLSLGVESCLSQQEKVVQLLICPPSFVNDISTLLNKQNVVSKSSLTLITLLLFFLLVCFPFLEKEKFSTAYTARIQKVYKKMNYGPFLPSLLLRY